MFQLLLVTLAASAYIIGSLPVHRFVGLADYDDPAVKKCRVRSVARVFINIMKGFIVVTIGCKLGPAGALVATYAVFIGHNYPLWSSFRGGTGLGTIFGAALAIDPTLGLFALAAWTFAYYSFQQRTAAAVGAAVFTPAAANFLDLPFSPVLFLPLTAMVLWRHRLALDLHIKGPKETEDHFRKL